MRCSTWMTGIGLVLAAAMVSVSIAETAAQKATIGQPAPSFSLQDQNGKTVSLDDYKGKIVVLEWINPQCPFVQRHYEAKTMTKLANQYRDKGVVWIAVNSTHDATPEDSQKWAQSHGMGYPILQDSKGEAGRMYGAKTTPHMYIIDAAGRLAYMGAIDNDPEGEKQDGKINYVRQALEEILAGKPVSTPETKSYGCSVKYAE